MLYKVTELGNSTSNSKSDLKRLDVDLFIKIKYRLHLILRGSCIVGLFVSGLSDNDLKPSKLFVFGEFLKNVFINYFSFVIISIFDLLFCKL